MTTNDSHFSTPEPNYTVFVFKDCITVEGIGFFTFKPERKENAVVSYCEPNSLGDKNFFFTNTFERDGEKSAPSPVAKKASLSNSSNQLKSIYHPGPGMKPARAVSAL